MKQNGCSSFQDRAHDNPLFGTCYIVSRGELILDFNFSHQGLLSEPRQRSRVAVYLISAQKARKARDVACRTPFVVCIYVRKGPGIILLAACLHRRKTHHFVVCTSVKKIFLGRKYHIDKNFCFRRIFLFVVQMEQWTRLNHVG